MKKFFAVIIFTMLCSVTALAEEQNLSGSGTVTYDDVLNNPPISLFQNTVAESCLYYDQLTEYEQKYYDDLKSNIELMTDGTYNYTFKLNMNVAKGCTSVEELQTAIFEELGLDISTYIFRPIYALTYLDSPQYFWLDINNMTATYGWNSYDSGTGNVNFIIILQPKIENSNYYFPDCYSSGDEVKSDYTNMMAKANEIVNSVPEKSSQWEKINYYMNWLRDNCHYNSDLTTATNMAYLAPSALLYGNTTTNAPVCEGYSEALKILCDLSGIDIMCTESFYELNGKTTGHKWNIVKLNNKYYHCDPTWFDAYTTIDAYKYFLTGSGNIAKYDTSLNHTIAHQMTFYDPVISETDYLDDVGINGYSVLNNDGNSVIDNKDSCKLLRKVSGIDTGGNDVNNDGEININDVVKMQQLMFE